MRSLNDLANEMRALANQLGRTGNEAAKDVATVCLKDLTEVTPVDTGAALSNWQLTLDNPASGILFPFFPSTKGRMKGGVWEHSADPVATAQANAPEVMAQAKLILGGKVPGQTIYITNNIPYIRQLNDGSSSQAPAGFVDRALILARQAVKNVKIP